MYFRKIEKISKVTLTEEEQELLNVLIFSGVSSYLHELDKVCRKDNDIQSFILILREVEELLTKLNFDFVVNVKEIENYEM